MAYADISSLIDTALELALALTVWVAYRELRRRLREDAHPSHMSNSSAA